MIASAIAEVFTLSQRAWRALSEPSASISSPGPALVKIATVGIVRKARTTVSAATLSAPKAERGISSRRQEARLPQAREPGAAARHAPHEAVGEIRVGRTGHDCDAVGDVRLQRA